MYAAASTGADRIAAAVPRRLDGLTRRSPSTRLGFSPSAEFIPAGERSTMSSTVSPQQRTATVWPPIGLPEPGVMPAGSTPPASASRNPSSAGSIASSTRTWAWTSPVSSFVSWPAQPSPSSRAPRWVSR